MLVLLEIFGLGEELLDELLALFLVSHLVLADDEPALVQHTGLVRQVLRACQLDLELMVVHDGWGDLLLRLIVGLLRDDIDFDELIGARDSVLVWQVGILVTLRLTLSLLLL